MRCIPFSIVDGAGTHRKLTLSGVEDPGVENEQLSCISLGIIFSQQWQRCDRVDNRRSFFTHSQAVTDLSRGGGAPVLVPGADLVLGDGDTLPGHGVGVVGDCTGAQGATGHKATMKLGGGRAGFPPHPSCHGAPRPELDELGEGLARHGDGALRRGGGEERIGARDRG